MNALLNPTQSDTKKGDIVVIANGNLTGLEGYLSKLISVGGITQASLPTSQRDIALFLVANGDIAGNEVAVEAPSSSNFRVKAKGAGAAGIVLVLADPAGDAGADAGMVTAIPATPGVYFSPGIAEEDFLDGQLVLARPFPRMVTVASADTLSALAFTADGATGPEVAALRTAIKTILEAQGVMA
jgi:hypothetical protein